MIDSLFILGAGGEVLIEKHWRATTSRAVVDQFWEEVSKYPRRDDVPPVIATPKHYFFHIRRGTLFYLALVTSEIPPLFVLEFLKRVYDIHSLYLSRVDESAVKDNFTTVYQLLEEMMDNGFPVLTEPNVLTSMVSPPSTLGRVVSAVSGRSSVASALPPNATSATPWRRIKPRYTQNEIFFDFVETVNCCVNGNGTIAHYSVSGSTFCNARLTGMPDLAVRFERPGLIKAASLHPCIRVGRWEREHVLSFVPPDGKFKLMTYTVPLKTPPQLPLYCRAQIAWGKEPGAPGKVTVIVGPRPHHTLVVKRKKDGRVVEPTVEDISVRIPFPRLVESADLKANQGRVLFDDKTKECVWTIGKLGREKSPELQGTVSIPSTELGPRGDSITVMLGFEISGATLSGLRIDSLRVSNESYTPYKGMRGLVRSGCYEIRQ